MTSECQSKGKKRSKAFYRKSAYGGKKQCLGTNVLEPGIRGFLVMCNHDERSAVRESYNILNEYADLLYGPDKNAGLCQSKEKTESEHTNNSDDDYECDDIEQALKKEVEELKKASSSPEKRFQNVATKAKNCVFIRTSLTKPIEVAVRIMEDIAEKHLKKARYAARILPIIGTCKANTKEIEKLAANVLTPIFTKDSAIVPSSFTILFKMRNNNGSNCGRESVIPVLINTVKSINPDIKFSWTEYSAAIIIEIVCTVCCLSVAPDYFRLRKYNLQELQQGPRVCVPSSTVASSELKEEMNAATSNIQNTDVNNDGKNPCLSNDTITKNGDQLIENCTVENEMVNIEQSTVLQNDQDTIMLPNKDKVISISNETTDVDCNKESVANNSL